MSEYRSPALTAETATDLFGRTRSGENVFLHTVKNGSLTLRCIDYGAAVVSLETPDRDGVRENVFLGYDTLAEYETDSCWCGLLCGPVAGRVADASFELEGVRCELEANDGTSCLHSGSAGFSHSVWHGETFSSPGEAGVRFRFSTLPGQWGFPGALAITATYTLSGNSLTLAWEAEASAPTLLAPAFHGYFNLGGDKTPSIADHRLALDADRFMPLDERHLPKMPEPVEGTAFDFRAPRSADHAPWASERQLCLGNGYDHPFLLNSPGDPRTPDIVLEHPASGRLMEVYTDQPTCVLYTGGSLNSSQRFSGGRRGAPGRALALETQWYPNAPALPDLPQPVLYPGESYRARTEWRFFPTT